MKAITMQPRFSAKAQRIVFGLFTAAALLLTGCDKENHDPDADPSLSISPTTEAIHFGAAAEESYTYKVTTNRLTWMAESDQSWCKLLIDAGENTLTVTAQPNDKSTSPVPATITITSDDAAPLTITATQDGAEYDLYISGAYTAGGTKKPCYWKNGTRIDLPVVDETGYGSTTAMTVSNGKVYIAGRGENTGCYWIDGVCHELKEYYGTRSIAVDNETVYVLGTNMLWKDGVLDDSDFGNDFSPQAITVSDGTLYLAGRLHLDTPLTGSADVAACGKLGVPHHLPTPIVSKKANAYCATASAGSVYVGGYYYDEDADIDRACFWKDRQKATPLETPRGNSEVRFICVENETVYSAGYNRRDGQMILCYWVNEKRMELQLPAGAKDSEVTGIAAAGGTVYVSGIYTDENYDAYASCYWIDGKLTILPETEGISDQYTSGIALVKK